MVSIVRGISFSESWSVYLLPDVSHIHFNSKKLSHPNYKDMGIAECTMRDM